MGLKFSNLISIYKFETFNRGWEYNSILTSYIQILKNVGMPSIRVYDISEYMYIVREEQKVEDLTWEFWIIHN